MRTYLNWESCYSTAIVLSFVFIVVNIMLTGRICLPWCDEVMLADAPVTFLTTGEWTTTAWYDTGNGYGAPYPYAFQMLQVVWGYVFGCSYISFHMMNYVLTLVLLLLIVRFVKIATGKELAVLPCALLTVLLWTPWQIAWVYNNGRYEIMCAMFIMLILTAALRYVRDGKSPLWIVLFTVLLVLTAIHTLPMLVYAAIMLFAIFKGHRIKIAKALGYYISGVAAAMAIICAYCASTGRIKDFGTFVLQHSATLKGLVVSNLPLLRQHGINLRGWEDMAVEKKLPFWDNVADAYSCVDGCAVLLAFLALSLLLFYVLQKKLPCKTCLMFAAFGVLMPLLMSLAGRFTPYYSWMFFIPMITAIALLYNQIERKYVIAIPCAFAAYLAATGIFSPNVINDARYDNVQAFVKQLNITDDDKIVAPFCVFYDIKPHNAHTYFIEVFNHIPDDVNIVIASSDAMYRDKIDSYLNTLQQDSTLQVTEVASQTDPDLHAYRIDRR